MTDSGSQLFALSSRLRPDYFADHPARVAALFAACSSWRGTPFRQHSRVKGPQGGVDCEWFVPSCLRECGALSADEFAAIVVPAYEVNHAEHSDHSLFEDFFRLPAVRARVRLLDEDEPHVDGDLVFPEVGRCIHHIGFRIGIVVHHIVRPSGYARMTLTQLKLHRSRYRLMEAPPTFEEDCGARFGNRSAPHGFPHIPALSSQPSTLSSDRQP